MITDTQRLKRRIDQDCAARLAPSSFLSARAARLMAHPPRGMDVAKCMALTVALLFASAVGVHATGCTEAWPAAVSDALCCVSFVVELLRLSKAFLRGTRARFQFGFVAVIRFGAGVHWPRLLQPDVTRRVVLRVR